MEIQNLPWYGQLAVFLLIGAALFGVFYFLHYKPTQGEIQNIVTQSESLQEEIRKAEKNEAKLEKLKEEKAANEKILEELKGILPMEKEAAQHLRKLSAIASNARLKPITFTFGQVTARDYYSEWPITISLEGNYHNLGIFFDQVSRMKKIFTIDKLTIIPLNTLSYDYTIKADFAASTYIYREAAPQKPVAARTPRRRVASDEAEGGF